MPRARLVDADRALRRARSLQEAERTIRHLRGLAAQVKRSRPSPEGRQLAILLANGAWAVEDLYKLHRKGDD